MADIIYTSTPPLDHTPRTLYSVILDGLVEWAGEYADMEDCRSVARHLTPIVRNYYIES